MAHTLFKATSLIALASLATAATQIRIFIDSVPEYGLLSSCAEYQVSTIVRNMENGCGDGSHTSSYICFCYQSSARYSSIIGSKVSTACTTDSAQNTSAVAVFSKYCQLGQIERELTGTTTSTPTSPSLSQSSTASPASGPATVFVTATPTPTSTSEAQSETKKSTPVVAIAVGVSVPVVIISLAIAIFLLCRRKRKEAPIELDTHDAYDNATEVGSGSEVHELKQDCIPPPIEIGGGREFAAELHSPDTLLREKYIVDERRV